MEKQDIIRMARESGLGLFIQYEKTRPFEALERFAALVAAAERQACCSADIVNAANINASDYPGQVVEKYRTAIRARSKHEH